jgi:hypothetical protein
MGLWDRIMYETQREKKLKELTAQIAKENKAKSSDKGAENKAVSMLRFSTFCVIFCVLTSSPLSYSDLFYRATDSPLPHFFLGLMADAHFQH